MTLDPPPTREYLAAMPPNERKSSHLKAIVLVVILIMVIATLWVILSYVLVSCYGCGIGPRPLSIGMAGGTPTTMACGTTANALYKESVSVTSTSGVITTNTLGLKVVPTAGGPNVANVAPPSSGSACPTTGGFYVALSDSGGTTIACLTGVVVGGSPVWSAPSGNSATCPSTNPITAVSSITINGGQTLVVYIYGEGNPVGAFSMQAYGLGGATVSGLIDL
jgi:hypothetical protein